VAGLTFGIALRGSAAASEFRDVVGRAEGLGCDVLAAPDHLGAPDPFAVLNAAAQITPRMRLRTYVLNVGLWNAALLARAAATTDLLSDGRVELGLGAGHMRSEHEDAGLPWPSHRERVDQMERTLDEVQRRLSAPDHEPRPVQSPIPVAVGAMTSPGLRVAARHADIVAFSGLLRAAGPSPGTFTLVSAAQTRAARRRGSRTRRRSQVPERRAAPGHPPGNRSESRGRRVGRRMGRHHARAAA
jgi:probable F420-dependent oxidoreductase